MQQLHVFYSILGFSILLASLFILILWLLNKEQQQKQQGMEQMNLIAEVTAQEKDKARIAYDLHEDFAQLLAAVKMFMGQFDLTNERDIDLRQQANTFINDGITKIRAIALEYLPYPLQQKNLAGGLDTYISYINKAHNELITLSIENELSPIPTHKGVGLYRIIQEIVTNTLEHAKATELCISLREEGDKLVVKTKDNGKGFDYQRALEKGKGLGLNNIITRVKLLKGMLSVSSAKGGTMYAIEIPI